MENLEESLSENLSESARVAKIFHEVMMLFRQNMTKVFEDIGITAHQGMVMGILSREKTLKITELSARLNLSNSTVSGIIDRLEKQGIVERNRSEEDKRVVHVSVSPKFREHHQFFHKRMDENFASILNKGTPEELKKIYEGLETLKKLLSIRDEKKAQE
ncbi:MarR family transcriptional regulator [Desulfosporosinus sp. PR]|uniref:MarR family winged helix-turn-helix transcriptional regulator n=1 Tax=Candidatus Desulfosporosinus nitrosoreducens TaxID=3401928 RepID=UPI0027F9782F|nr:MarR family transcriptional regulator [Desulfosporosinus sp. PR]MDQ7092120.1 MarR family transcriptional regulator [Desulfosporosinus sp. PR]